MRLAALCAAFLLRGTPANASAEPAPPPVDSPPPVAERASPTQSGESTPGETARAQEDPKGTTTRTPSSATVIEEITGTVASIDRRSQKVEIATSKGARILSLDRNTLVFTTAGLGTVRDLKPGVAVRAGRNALSSAYWIQIWPSSPLPGVAPSGPAGPSTKAAEAATTGIAGPKETAPPPASGAGKVRKEENDPSSTNQP